MVKWSILFESFPCEEIKLKSKQLSIKLELGLSCFISNRYHLTTVLTAVNQGKSRFGHRQNLIMAMTQQGWPMLTIHTWWT